MALRDEHLADLHRRARELGVPDYRMLGRDELVEAIEERDGGDGAGGRDEAVDAGLERPRHEESEKPDETGETGETGETEDEEHGEAGDGEEPPDEETATEDVSGVLDRMPQGYGFLRLSGLHETEGDVYVSASQIRRCELRPGDEVSGPARAPRRGERHRALVRV
ncbi:MAG TPA: hypothetical protein VFN72_13580, partial [Solirubrobacterales bacterium]|nr:hypothetical protein [Solirubrobacterales bacterium]